VTKHSISVRAAAVRDLREAARYYSDEGGEAVARSFGTAARKALAHIEHFPKSGSGRRDAETALE
jgi:plasmid stabilization system protein ParE